MKKITRKHGVAFLAFALASFNLTAQEGDGEATTELNPLNVIDSKGESPTLSSGLKSSLPANKVPQSLSIVRDEQIKAQGLKSIGDIIDYTPGVNNSQGEGHRDSAVFRGMRTTQDFYRDGVRDDVQYYRPLYNVEQVEVLRGPNAVVSGFGAGYGLINRVSKKGVIGADFTSLSGSVDTFGETNVQLDKNMQLNENTAFRVNIFGENLSNHRDFYYGDAFGVNPTLLYDLGDDSTLSISYEYLDQERFIDRGIPTGADNKPVNALKDYVFGDSSENFSTHEAHILSAIFEHSISDTWQGKLSASHSSHDKLYQNHYAKSYDAGATIADSNVTLEGYRDTTQRDTSILSYNISGQLETGSIVHNILAGFEYTATDNNNDRYYSDWSSLRGSDTKFNKKGYSKEKFRISRNMVTGNVGRESVDQNVTTNNYTMSPHDDTHGELSVFSLYLQDEINLSDALDLILGLRFDSMEYDVVDIYDNGEKISDSDETFSPKAGIVFSATDELSFYASYSETFQQIKGDQYASLNKTDSKSDHSTFENLETGLRYDFASGLSFSASVYELNFIKPTTNDNGASFVNTEAETTGLELQLQGNITDKWFISAGYTSLDATNEVGLDLRESPDSSFSLFNNYQVTDRLGVNLGIVYYDKSLINNPKYDDHDKDPATPKTWKTYDQYLPDYARVDVGASYLISDNTSVQLNVENLTDELYYPHAHGSHQASVGAPINAMLSITSSF